MELRKNTTFVYDFSIWYSETDEDIASTVAEILRSSGHCGYLEHQDELGGMLAISSVTDIICRSSVTFVILSANSLKNYWCQKVLEWNLFHSIEQAGTKFIPVYANVQDEQVPVVLRHISGLKYSSTFFKTKLLGSMKSKKVRCKRFTS